MSFDELMRCHEANSQTYQELLEILKNGAAVPFIGSGLFKSWTKFETWTGLLRVLAEENSLSNDVEADLANHNYEEAASRISSKAEGAFYTTLKQKFNKTPAMDSIPHYFECLPDIFRNMVITTNYDTVIEGIYNARGVHLDKILPIKDGDFIETTANVSLCKGRPLLVKLHGCIDNYENVVLTKEKYDDIYGLGKTDKDKPIPMLLQRIFTSKTVLFLGCSLENDRTLDVLEECKAKGVEYFSFQELPACTRNKMDAFKPVYKNNDGFSVEYMNRLNFMRSKKIQCIWFPHGQYQCIEIFLKRLTEDMNIGRPNYKMDIGTMIKLADGFFDEGNLNLALENYRKTYDSFEHDIGVPLITKLSLIDKIYEIFYRCSEFPDSIEWIKKSIHLHETRIDGDDFGLFQKYRKLSHAYSHCGDDAKGLETIKNAAMRTPTTDKKNVADIQGALGDFDYLNDNLHSALAHYMNALSYAKSHETSDPDFAVYIYRSIGKTNTRLGHFEDAAKYIQKSLDIGLKYGKNPMSIADSYQKLGDFYCSMGDTQNAIQNYKTAVEKMKKLLMPEHHTLAYGYEKIAGVYFETENYDAALMHYKIALSIRNRYKFGERSKSLLLSKISKAYKAKREYTLALEYLLSSGLVEGKSISENSELHKELEELYQSSGAEHLNFRDWLEVRLGTSVSIRGID